MSGAHSVLVEGKGVHPEFCLCTILYAHHVSDPIIEIKNRAISTMKKIFCIACPLRYADREKPNCGFHPSMYSHVMA